MKEIHLNYPKANYYGTQSTDYPNMFVSKSMLTKFMPDPKWWKATPPTPYTKAMKFGNLVDCLALTPSEFENEYVIAPKNYPCEPTKKDPRTEKPWNMSANFCKDWAESQTKDIVNQADYLESMQAVNNLKSFPAYIELMDRADTQVALFGELEGVKVKSLLDILPRCERFSNALADMKTTAEMSEQHFARTVARFGYHRQAALYLDLYNAITGENRDKFYIVWVNSKAPFQCAMRPLSPSAISEGRRWYKSALRQWKQCITTDVWPSPWDDTETPTDLPAFVELTDLDNDNEPE